MKINEKTLIKYANSSLVKTDLEGYLLKRGEVNRAFQRRWFVLKGNLLFYYERKGDREPLGVIVLEGCAIEVADNECDLFCLQIVFGGLIARTYILGTSSPDNLEVWMKALSKSSFDYIRLM